MNNRTSVLVKLAMEQGQSYGGDGYAFTAGLLEGLLKQVETEPEVNIHNVIEILIKRLGNKKAA